MSADPHPACTWPGLPLPAPRTACGIALLLLVLVACPQARAGDTLAAVRSTGRLVYGTDTEGGAPYIYPDPDDTSRTIGFEVELMDLLARRIGVQAIPQHGNWDRLLPSLAAGRIDVVCNGYERLPARLETSIATRPYFVYQLQLVGRRGGQLTSWEDLRGPRPDGKPWRIGVLFTSVAERYGQEMAAFRALQAERDTIEIVGRDSVVDAIREVQNEQLDATLQDDIAARFFLHQEEYRDLRPLGPPQGGGYYVMYLRPEDTGLRDALDSALEHATRSGQLQQILERYQLWSPAQEELLSWEAPESATYTPDRGAWAILRSNAHFLLDASLMTILLSCASMPLAMAAGLSIALGRRYGPGPLRWLLSAYVELIRGTPLMLQLFVLYFLLPEIGIILDDLVAGILGLAINYSAYESEVYRAGLQAVPPGQMEAARALGMTKLTALRRIIVPQAARIVIPPVTSDFITLLKDSSVCSVIGLVELSKRYSILVNNNGHILMFAALTAGIYLAMSLPLARLSHWLEHRLENGWSPETSP